MNFQRSQSFIGNNRALAITGCNRPEAWQQSLPVGQIIRWDKFFDLGGHSLTATGRTAARVVENPAEK